MVGTRGKKIDIHELLQTNKRWSPIKRSTEKSPYKGHTSPQQKSPKTTYSVSCREPFVQEGKQRAVYEDPAVNIGEDSYKVKNEIVPNNRLHTVSLLSEDDGGGSQGRRGRGRPRKTVPHGLGQCAPAVSETESLVVKRKRGRPKRSLSNVENGQKAATIPDIVAPTPNVKRGRGRPRKVTPFKLPNVTVASGSVDCIPPQLLKPGSNSWKNNAVLESPGSGEAVDLIKSHDCFHPCAVPVASKENSCATAGLDCSKSGATAVSHSNGEEKKATWKRSGSPLESQLLKKSVTNPELVTPSIGATTPKSVTMKHIPREVPELKLSWSKNTRINHAKSNLLPHSTSERVDNGVNEKVVQKQSENSLLMDTSTNHSEKDVHLVSEEDDLPDTKETLVLNDQHKNVPAEASDDNSWPVDGQSEIDSSNLNALVDEAANQVILIVPSKISDSQVEQFIAENLVDIPNSYVIKREPADVDETNEDMNSLDVLVQLAVEDGRMQNLVQREPGKGAFDQVHCNICFRL